MGDADLAFLEFHGLEWDAMLSRPEGDRTPDDILKRKMLRQYAASLGVPWQRFIKFSVMWDDCEKVIRRLTADGLVVHNSNYINKVFGFMRKLLIIDTETTAKNQSVADFGAVLADLSAPRRGWVRAGNPRIGLICLWGIRPTRALA